MDRKVSNKIKAKKTKKQIFKIIAGLVIFGFLLSAFISILQPSIDKAEFLMATVEYGNMEASLTASGIVAPKFEEVLTSPIKTKILKVYHTTGENIIKGEQILELDKRETLSLLEKMKDELLVKENKIKQLKLRLEKTLIDLKTSYEIKKMEVEASKSYVEEEKHLLKIGGGTLEKVKKAELNEKVEMLRVQQLKASIENTEKSMEVDLEELSLGISIQKKSINELTHKLGLAEFLAPSDGALTRVEERVGISINEGDVLVSLADLNSFKIEAKISENQAKNLTINGKVKIILSDTSFYGHIINIQPNVEREVIRFNIRIDNKYCKLLRPNQKVDIAVVTSFKEKVLRVKNGSFYRGEINKDIFVINNNIAIKRSVVFGESNFDYVEIISGLQKGDMIITSDMSDFDNNDEVKIN